MPQYSTYANTEVICVLCSTNWQRHRQIVHLAPVHAKAVSNESGLRKPGTLIKADGCSVGRNDLQVDPFHLRIGFRPFDRDVQQTLSEARASPFTMHAHAQQATMNHVRSGMSPQVGMADDPVLSSQGDPGPTPSRIGRIHIQGAAETSCSLARKVAVDSSNGLKQRLPFGPVVGNVIVQVFRERRKSLG